jgi:hypothetical protein
MRKRLQYLLIALMGTVAMASCASSGGGTRPVGSTITAEDLDNLGPGISAYDAIERLRPVWLRDRGVSSPNFTSPEDALPRVHIDTTPYDLSALRSFRTTDIQSITFMEGRDATTRYGTGYVTGLIVVTTRTGARPPGA